MEYLINALRYQQSIKSRMNNVDQISIISGKALKIDKVRAVLRKSDESFGTKAIQPSVASFPLVTDDEEFMKAFNPRRTDILNILYDSISSERIRPKS